MLKVLSVFLVFSLSITSNVQAADLRVNPASKSFKYSTTVEKERPQLNEETKKLIAAGHMPKDADMNAGKNDGLSSVTEYAQTKSASGAINMRGNVWEWTSTDRNKKNKAIKGEAWNSKRTDCRTEARYESRDPDKGYDNVGFRVLKIK